MTLFVCVCVCAHVIFFNQLFFCYCEQTCAGAAMLTDVVFWLIIFPFLTYKDYKVYTEIC